MKKNYNGHIPGKKIFQTNKLLANKFHLKRSF